VPCDSDGNTVSRAKEKGTTHTAKESSKITTQKTETGKAGASENSQPTQKGAWETQVLLYSRLLYTTVLFYSIRQAM
jgi:hypothetical protein